MPRARLRVALVAVDLWEYSVALANALARECDVHLYVPDRAIRQHGDQLDDGVTVLTFRKPRLRDVRGQIRMCRELLRRIRLLEPDLVHMQSAHLWFSLALRFLRSCPRVLTVHDVTIHPGDRNSARTPQWVRHRAVAHSDHRIVHARANAASLIDTGRAAQGTVHVVPHIALLEPVVRSAGAEDDGLLLFFGRIWPYKGLEYLLRAEPLIAQECPGVRTVIAGEGEEFGRYERLMADPARFEVHNRFVTAEERAALFARASVVVLPYTEASMSGVVPVAYAHGKPVVATRVGGLPEIVDDGETGLLVAPCDEAALADAVVRLLRDGALRRRLGAGGRRKLEHELSSAAVARATLNVYERALRPSSSGTSESVEQVGART